MDTDTPSAPPDDTDNFLAKLEDISQLLTMDDARFGAPFDPLFDDVPEEPPQPPPNSFDTYRYNVQKPADKTKQSS